MKAAAILIALVLCAGCKGRSEAASTYKALGDALANDNYDEAMRLTSGDALQAISRMKAEQTTAHLRLKGTYTDLRGVNDGTRYDFSKEEANGNDVLIEATFINKRGRPMGGPMPAIKKHHTVTVSKLPTTGEWRVTKFEETDQ